MMNIEDQLETVVFHFRRILKTKLVGVYLHGSLALGCFNLQRSDMTALVAYRADGKAEMLDANDLQPFRSWARQVLSLP